MRAPHYLAAKADIRELTNKKWKSYLNALSHLPMSIQEQGKFVAKDENTQSFIKLRPSYRILRVVLHHNDLANKFFKLFK
jgi:hypothetical protein